jgi:pyridoxamine 5'-phosphate oxidase family protein
MTELTASHELTSSHIDYLASQLLARLATSGADHRPHVVPTPFRYNAELVSIDPWTPRMLEIRGRAEAIPTGGAYLGRGFGEALIRIYPEKVNSFGIA